MTKRTPGPGSMESTAPHSAADDPCSPYAATSTDLQALDEMPYEESETTSFDLYNSGRLDSTSYR